MVKAAVSSLVCSSRLSHSPVATDLRPHAKFESAFCDYYEIFSPDIDTDDDDYSGVSDDVSESVGSGWIVDSEPISVENACEVDTFEFTDFNTTDYYDLLVEAAAILGTSVVFRDNVIPEEEIDNVCQVTMHSTHTRKRIRAASNRLPKGFSSQRVTQADDCPVSRSKRRLGHGVVNCGHGLGV